MRARLPLALMMLAACASHAERTASVQELHLADTALVSIPDAASDGRYAMSTLGGSTRLHDGGIAVWAGSELFLFDSAGSYRRRFGGRGDGPGEFSFISGGAECRPGSILLWDAAQRRITGVDLAADTVDVRSEPGVAHQSRFVGCEGGDAIVAAGDFDMGFELVHDTVQIVRIASETGALDTITSGPGLVHVGPVARFSPFTVAAARGNALVVGNNGTGQLIRWDGSSRDTIKVHMAREAVTPEQEDSVKDWWKLRSGSKGAPQDPEVQRMIDNAWSRLPAADSEPLFSAMLLDDRGTIWLSEYAGYPGQSPIRPTRWTALDGAGLPTATLALPAGFLLDEIAGATALGIWENPDGSLALQIRAIER